MNLSTFSFRKKLLIICVHTLCACVVLRNVFLLPQNAPKCVGGLVLPRTAGGAPVTGFREYLRKKVKKMKKSVREKGRGGEMNKNEARSLRNPSYTLRWLMFKCLHCFCPYSIAVSADIADHLLSAGASGPARYLISLPVSCTGFHILPP